LSYEVQLTNVKRNSGDTKMLEDSKMIRERNCSMV
jgi:hypothetical protein